MKPFIRITVAAILIFAIGCACSSVSGRDDALIRQGIDLPDHFLIATQSGRVEPSSDGTCHNPMVDPRDGTSLTLMRSAEGRGDYEVPESRYGAGPNELLRLECATGRPLGIVKR